MRSKGKIWVEHYPKTVGALPRSYNTTMHWNENISSGWLVDGANTRKLVFQIERGSDFRVSRHKIVRDDYGAALQELTADQTVEQITLLNSLSHTVVAYTQKSAINVIVTESFKGTAHLVVTNTQKWHKNNWNFQINNYRWHLMSQAIITLQLAAYQLYLHCT